MAGRRRSPVRRPDATLGAWFSHHGQSALASLGDLARAPLASFMTVAVVGIALALPAALHLATRNLAALAQGWQEGTALSLFLAPDTVHTQAGTLELVQLAQPVADAARQNIGSLDINTLGPLALAFLAGYSVELVFAAMDRIIGAFTGDTRRRRAPPPRRAGASRSRRPRTRGKRGTARGGPPRRPARRAA